MRQGLNSSHRSPTAIGLSTAAGSHQSSPSPREARTGRGLGRGVSKLGQQPSSPRPSPSLVRYLFTVAQIFNLPYRRFVIGRTLLAGSSCHASRASGFWTGSKPTSAQSGFRNPRTSFRPTRSSSTAKNAENTKRNWLSETEFVHQPVGTAVSLEIPFFAILAFFAVYHLPSSCSLPSLGFGLGNEHDFLPDFARKPGR